MLQAEQWKVFTFDTTTHGDTTTFFLTLVTNLQKRIMEFRDTPQINHSHATCT